MFNPTDGATHRYIGASSGCWDLYTRLLSGEPRMAPSGSGGLLVDAYAAQHPGDNSPQATQSVAVHLVVLEGILGQGERHEDAIRLRVAAVEFGRKHNGFAKLEPEPSSWDLTVQDVVSAADTRERGEVATRYVETVWLSWRESHGETIGVWYRSTWPR